MDQERNQMSTDTHTPAPDPQTVDTDYSGEGRSANQIQSDIHQTRGQMSQTVDQLEHRLSPQRIWNEILDSLKDEARRSKLVNTVRDNPLPALLLAAGAGWMAIDVTRTPNGSDKKRRNYDLDSDTNREIDRETAVKSGTYVKDDSNGDDSESMADKAKRGLKTAGNKATHLADKAKDKAHHAAETVKGKANHAASEVKDSAAAARDKARHAGHQAREQTERAAEKAKQSLIDSYQDHPLVLGALAAAAGTVLGVLLPSTRKEDETLGPVRDKALHEAENAGKDLAHRAEAVADQALEAAEDEAEKQDLTADEIATSAKETAKEFGEKTKRVGQAAKDAAEDEAENQDLKPEQLKDTAKDKAEEVHNKKTS